MITEKSQIKQQAISTVKKKDQNFTIFILKHLVVFRKPSLSRSSVWHNAQPIGFHCTVLFKLGAKVYSWEPVSSPSQGSYPLYVCLIILIKAYFEPSQEKHHFYFISILLQFLTALPDKNALIVTGR